LRSPSDREEKYPASPIVGSKINFCYDAHYQEEQPVSDARSPVSSSAFQPFSSPTNLRGRVALVTGVGRQRGIGSAVCRALAARGADVVFSYWKAYDREMPWASEEDEPQSLLGELRATGVRAEGVEVDLSLPDSARRLLDRSEEAIGRPSILVNVAAYSSHDGFEELDAETLDAHYAVNVRTMALLSVEFARRYPGGPDGRIINFSSGQTLGPMPGELAYVATKGAIEAFTRTLAAEVGHKGITVNAVNPGPTDTGWISEELAQELLPKFPLGRIGQPEDAAMLVAFLASDEAAWITGQIINSEGGFIRS
jgi:3-oxoacyl-[acyl-carrier protein] reductase